LLTIHYISLGHLCLALFSLVDSVNHNLVSKLPFACYNNYFSFHIGLMLVFNRCHFIMLKFLIVRFAIILVSYFGKVSFEVTNNLVIVTN
jgi:hypothetical protein